MKIWGLDIWQQWYMRKQTARKSGEKKTDLNFNLNTIIYIFSIKVWGPWCFKRRQTLTTHLMTASEEGRVDVARYRIDIYTRSESQFNFKNQQIKTQQWKLQWKLSKWCSDLKNNMFESTVQKFMQPLKNNDTSFFALNVLSLAFHHSATQAFLLILCFCRRRWTQTHLIFQMLLFLNKWDFLWMKKTPQISWKVVHKVAFHIIWINFWID